jgi:hypothetical protein
MGRLRVLLALSGWLALAATVLPDGSPVRVALVLGFVLVCPGVAAVRLAQAVLRRVGARSMDGLEAVVVAVATSLALGALVSEAFFLAQSYTSTRVLTVLAVFTTVAAVVPVARRHGDRVR